MSAGYASRLKEYPNKGVCGLPEGRETKRALSVKLERLGELVRRCRGHRGRSSPRGGGGGGIGGRIVVLTGAGISTAAGVPDFRGPRGIWTQEMKHQRQEKRRRRQRQRQQEPTNTASKKRKRDFDDGKLQHPSSSSPPLSKAELTAAAAAAAADGNENNGGGGADAADAVAAIDFAKAEPTYTHRALTKLVSEGVVRYVVTQNVDGLHKRAGLSRRHHAALHGCVFTEKCETCRAEFFLDAETNGMSFRPTGRTCRFCNGVLRDTLLDWEDPLPEDDFDRAREECEKADLVLCLGTSLRIEPAGNLPTLAKKFVIVNLQPTPYDNDAELVIRCRVDDVMKHLMEECGLEFSSDGSNCNENWLASPPAVERVWRPDNSNNNGDDDDDDGGVDNNKSDSSDATNE